MAAHTAELAETLLVGAEGLLEGRLDVADNATRWQLLGAAHELAVVEGCEVASLLVKAAVHFAWAALAPAGELGAEDDLEAGEQYLERARGMI
jgi:hypothetical protein